jgi:hypothetical protein
MAWGAIIVAISTGVSTRVFKGVMAVGSLMRTTVGGSYPYAGTEYASPHVVTQIGNRTATTTLSYD